MNAYPAPGPMAVRYLPRWAWRQLTSMKTAIMLLLLLALASVPGSLYPQRSVDPFKVANYYLAHPRTAPVLDRLGAFSVFSSPWFSAIYLLLVVSLVGCLIPRTLVHLRAVRSRPPTVPANLHRLPSYRSFGTDASVDDALRASAQTLRRRRFRVERVGDGVSAEAGYAREVGNLVFHICLLVVIVGVAITSLYGYRGAVVVVEKESFSNALPSYDDFSAGALYARSRLPQFTLSLDDMQAKFQTSGPQRGAPRLFEATGTYTMPGSGARRFDMTVNHPLKIGSTSVFLIGQGYAPVVRVKDKSGRIAFEGAVPFLPRDGSYVSEGVIKAPDARPAQLGFQGFLLPTAVSVPGQPQASAFPAAANPVLNLVAFTGDLGLDTGAPQSVYTLDKTNLRQVFGASGSRARLSLSLGQEQTLPDGLGSIEFVRLRQFARLQVASAPGAFIPLTGTSIGVLGLVLSLSIRPRRVWVKATRQAGRTTIHLGGLSKVNRGDVEADLTALEDEMVRAVPATFIRADA